MTEPATADPPALRLLAPVPPGERILALDVLRGICEGVLIGRLDPEWPVRALAETQPIDPPST